MSRIFAELSGNELIIQNIERHRKGDKDIQIINLEDLDLNRQYRSEVKISNSKQLNKIILMQEISNEFALSISIKKAQNQEKSEEEIQDIKDEHEDLINNDEMKKRAVAVYIKDEKLYYCYGEISQIYKKLIQYKIEMLIGMYLQKQIKNAINKICRGIISEIDKDQELNICKRSF